MTKDRVTIIADNLPRGVAGLTLELSRRLTGYYAWYAATPDIESLNKSGKTAAAIHMKSYEHNVFTAAYAIDFIDWKVLSRQAGIFSDMFMHKYREYIWWKYVPNLAIYRLGPEYLPGILPYLSAKQIAFLQKIPIDCIALCRRPALRNVTPGQLDLGKLPASYVNSDIISAEIVPAFRDIGRKIPIWVLKNADDRILREVAVHLPITAEMIRELNLNYYWILRRFGEDKTMKMLVDAGKIDDDVGEFYVYIANNCRENMDIINYLVDKLLLFDTWVYLENKVDWRLISGSSLCSEIGFLAEHIDDVCWEIVSVSQTITPTIFNKFADKLQWKEMLLMGDCRVPVCEFSGYLAVSRRNPR